MKKIIITSFVFILAANIYSQNGPPWKPTGNTASAGDFLGTTNNFSLDFRTNNIKQMSLGTNGILTLNSLSGVGNRVLVTDANGNMTALPSTVSNALTAWDSNGSNIFFNGGNLGIGTSSPAYKLDVLGDARVSNNLYVGGGVIVTNKLDASVHVKAGDVIVNNDLSVAGNSNFLGVLTAARGMMVDNTTGISYTPGNTPGTGTFQLGKIQPIAVPCAALPGSPLTVGMGGNVQIYDPSNSVNGGLLNLQTWTGGSSIDASVGGNIGASGLLLNYFCGSNTFINTGALGGDVSIGGFGNVFLTKTTIRSYNTSSPNALDVIDPSNSSVSFRVKNNGFVYAREINVQTTTFPDYVFDKSYKRLTISELDNYVTTNKHLPGFKKAEEYIKDGLNVNEVLIRQQEKIEELALYIIELKKEVDALKNK